mmetsp:Transcript_86741/g.165749  ORF Transcript_86741/g.165749 Transcript_86741/m.165749 type:complete len:348 (+) Transcript_86741:86-1129(+)
MAPAVAPAHGQMRDPLLPDFDAEPPRDWVRRLAGWRGPEPVTVARVFMLCGAIAAIADYRLKYHRALRRGVPAEPSVVSFAADAQVSLSDFEKEYPKTTITLIITACLVAVLIAMTIISRRWAQSHFCKKILEGIAQFDQEFVGAQILIKNLQFNMWTGRFVTNGLIVANPLGFKNPFLIQVAHCNFGVEIGRTLRTRKHVYLKDLRLKGVTFKIEKDGLPYSGQTNLDVLLKHMADGRPSEIHKAIKRHEIENYDAQLVEHDEAVRDEQEIVNLKTVNIMDITVEAEGSKGPIKIPDITYEHFAEEEEHKDMHSSEGACHLDDLVYVLMMKSCNQVAKELEKVSFL